MRKRRIGTAKFFTLLLLLYHTSAKIQGMTQAELAKRAGIPRTNITRFESGNYNPSLEMLVRIAAALGMTLQVQLMAKE